MRPKEPTLTLFEVAFDTNDRPMLLAEDIQRWMLSHADEWQALSLKSFWNGAVYAHTALTLRGMAGELSNIEVVDLTG